MQKMRLDLVLMERGLAESRAKAQALIMAGQVRVDGQTVLKSSAAIEDTAQVAVDQGPRFVSRGGEKLDAALSAFHVEVQGRVCADVGASTGGFSDCLLQRGAARIYALDVGKGILHWKLRNDARVVVLEETNARFVESLPAPISLVVMDASFISLRVLLPVVKKWLGAPVRAPLADRSEAAAGVVALIKPQFEAGRKDVRRGSGVIRDPAIHEHVLREVLGFAEAEGFRAHGLIQSPLVGPKGNIEFLVWLKEEPASTGVEELIRAALSSPAKA